jgi:hypothetical protein
MLSFSSWYGFNEVAAWGRVCGRARNSELILAGADPKGFHCDATALVDELTHNGVRRGQFGQAPSISHPLVSKLTLSGEVWHFAQPFLHSHAVGNLWALSYATRRNLAFDGDLTEHLNAVGSFRWLHVLASASALVVALPCTKWVQA